MTNRKIEYWVIPPEADAEFVANMEEVLETYAKPYDPDASGALHGRAAGAIGQGDPKADRGHREASPARRLRVRAGGHGEYLHVHRTALRMADGNRAPVEDESGLGIEMARLLDGRYKGCEKVILVCDNLNTHTKGAFYEAFAPAQARQYVRRIEFRHTPKHGSWLNIAENELSSMTRQCIGGRRFGDLKTLREQIRAWSNDVNKTQRGVDWQMKIDDARCKLKSVYPKIKL